MPAAELGGAQGLEPAAAERGREFSEQDSASAPRVIVINEAAARRFWPGESPVGKRIEIICSPGPGGRGFPW